MDAGTRLRLKRESLGLTCDDVAKACGVGAEVVQGWEHGRYAPTATLAHRLACMLGLTMEQVYGFAPATGAAALQGTRAAGVDGARLHRQLDRVIELLQVRGGVGG